MLEILSLLLPFFGLIFLGFGAGRYAGIPEAGLAWLNYFVTYLALPSLFIQLLSQTPIEQLQNWGFVFATTFSSYAAFALTFCIAVVITRGNVALATMQGLLGSYANVGYMGPGLTLAVLGAHATAPTALIFCFDVTLFFILAPTLMALQTSTSGSFRTEAVGVLRKVLLHPFILSTMIGITMAALQIKPPAALDQLLTFLRSAAAPCALFAMGVTIALRPLRRVPGELMWILTVKLMVHPLIVYLVLSWTGGIDPIWMKTAVLMASLPPAATSFIIAQQYNVYVERTSSGIMLGTAASVFTVTLVLYVISQGWLPV